MPLATISGSLEPAHTCSHLALGSPANAPLRHQTPVSGGQSLPDCSQGARMWGGREPGYQEEGFRGYTVWPAASRLFLVSSRARLMAGVGLV